LASPDETSPQARTGLRQLCFRAIVQGELS
jgi:hypothetical protein